MLPHHDVWLRDVLDQQFMGHSWTQVQRGFERMITACTLYYHAWPVPSWAFPDEAIENNTKALDVVPADIKVICPGRGPDGSLTLRTSLALDPVCGKRPHEGIDGMAYVLLAGDRMDLEIGHVSPLRMYQALTGVGKIARFPYDFEADMEPHLFVLCCSEPKEYRD